MSPDSPSESGAKAAQPARPAKAAPRARSASASGKTTTTKAPARVAAARPGPPTGEASTAAVFTAVASDGPPATPRASVAGAASSRPAPVLPAGSGPSRSGWRALADPSSPALVYVGVVAVVVGFALLFLAWSEVAAQADVWRQMPFVLSAGFPGLGLIMTGLVMASIGVRRQEGVRRQRQMAALTEALRSVEQQVG